MKISLYLTENKKREPANSPVMFPNVKPSGLVVLEVFYLGTSNLIFTYFRNQIKNADVVQRTEYVPTKLEIQVRFLASAFFILL